MPAAERIELRTADNTAPTQVATAKHFDLDGISVPVRQKKKVLYPILKRAMDITLSAIALILASPLFLIVAIAIKLDSKGPAFFTQTRVGRNGKEFVIYKFRSMCIDAEKKLENLRVLNERDGPVFKIHNDPRVTKVGRFIRSTCIDELPQLINVIKGDMSLVGPRPPLPSEVKEYSNYQKRRLDVIPGLTCYWQVSGRVGISFNEWVEMDLKYIRECGISTDIVLIAKTFYIILKKRGAV